MSIIELPIDIWEIILHQLDDKSKRTACRVCISWMQLLLNDCVNTKTLVYLIRRLNNIHRVVNILDYDAINMIYLKVPRRIIHYTLIQKNKIADAMKLFYEHENYDAEALDVYNILHYHIKLYPQITINFLQDKYFLRTFHTPEMIISAALSHLFVNPYISRLIKKYGIRNYNITYLLDAPIKYYAKNKQLICKTYPGILSINNQLIKEFMLYCDVLNDIRPINNWLVMYYRLCTYSISPRHKFVEYILLHTPLTESNLDCFYVMSRMTGDRYKLFDVLYRNIPYYRSNTFRAKTNERIYIDVHIHEEHPININATTSLYEPVMDLVGNREVIGLSSLRNKPDTLQKYKWPAFQSYHCDATI